MERALVNWLHAAPRHRRLRIADLPIEPDAIGRALGYGPPRARAIPDHVAATIARVQHRSETLIAPRMFWATMPGEVVAQSLVCRGTRPGRLAIGSIVAGQIRLCEAVAVFVVSIGEDLEFEARRTMAESDVLDGYVLDALGSVAADACAEAVARMIAIEAQQIGWKTTNRYSPGYCSWPTQDQHALFGLLPKEPAGVRLSASGLMHPIKSVSGVIGLGAQVKFHPYPCAFCGIEDCRQRLVESKL